MVALLITIIILLIVIAVLLVQKNEVQPPQFHITVTSEQPTDNKPYNNPVTGAQQKLIDRQMKEFLERSPNLTFWDDHPEYKEKYLKDIDLGELGV